MKFKGGIHPQYRKVTADRAIRAMPLLERYIVPVGQHIGAPGEVIVEKGQVVQRGEPLTKPAGFVSVPVQEDCRLSASPGASATGPRTDSRRGRHLVRRDRPRGRLAQAERRHPA